MEPGSRKRKTMEDVNAEQIISDCLDKKVQPTDNTIKEQLPPNRKKECEGTNINENTEPNETESNGIKSFNENNVVKVAKHGKLKACVICNDKIERTFNFLKNKRQLMKPLINYFFKTQTYFLNCYKSMEFYSRQMQDLERPVPAKMRKVMDDVRQLADQYEKFEAKYLAFYNSPSEKIVEKVKKLWEETIHKGIRVSTATTKEQIEPLIFELPEWFQSIPDPVAMNTEWVAMDMDTKVKGCHCVIKEWINDKHA